MTDQICVDEQGEVWWEWEMRDGSDEASPRSDAMEIALLPGLALKEDGRRGVGEEGAIRG
jgi:hypothetical protein